ncbi:EAL domain-containing protein [Labrenzia sp. PHM005]|uniref:EAL domain-containing protein n=1 Tax=Labrenzia sp. PHM005 TaxID=2590016 RepID=UPI00352D8707
MTGLATADKTLLDMVWVLVAAGFVFFMQVGFMLLEAGAVRSKNSINVVQKNLLDFAISVAVFSFFGYMLVLGSGGNWFAGIDSRLFMLSDLDPWTFTVFTFQVMFCGTAATIVSGAVAERMRLFAYIICTVLTAGILYPIFAHWVWGRVLFESGQALLADKGFVDFAGATVVHGTGAWVALAACIIIGPRLGRFDEKGRPVRINGYSAVIATAGAMVLAVGWIGFNGGALLGVSWDVAGIIINTVLASSAGVIAGFCFGFVRDRLLLPENSICGLLGGLVAVTAGCHILTPAGAFVIGFAGGAVAVTGALILERVFKIDDPVSAISIHGFAGGCGTLGFIFLVPAENLPLGSYLPQFWVQLQGVWVNFIWCFGTACLVLGTVNRFFALRVDYESEDRGLNEAEHGTRLGIGHVEDALDRLIGGKADLSLRLEVSRGDEAERMTRLFNLLMDSIQNEEQAITRAKDVKRTREEAERLSALANATFDAIVITVDGQILDGNAALAGLLGYSIKDLEMRSFQEFFHHEGVEELEKHLAEAGEQAREFIILNRDGLEVPVEIRTREISYRGKPTRVSALVDLSDRKVAEAQILHLAQHDPLTDLSNRTVFNRNLEKLIGLETITDIKGALLLLDLDRFKEINDTHGHPVGDTVIKQTAERLKSITRGGDTVARLGGDEFAVILKGIETAEVSEDMALRLVNRLSDPIECDDGLVVQPSVSIGVTMIMAQNSADKTINDADVALYKAKSKGRNTFCLFQDGMGDEVRQRRILEQDLAEGIVNDEFRLFFQPRYDIGNQKISGYEALIRWNHPERGVVSPAEFIPIAESSGKIDQIGKWVLREALEAAKAVPDAKISVNVSPVQFRDVDFVSDVEAAITASGVSANRLELEITETTLIEDDSRALAILTAIKDLGAKVALDDFGVGYSSLSCLSRFPFDYIKIDRSFVEDTEENANSMAIIETVVRLGNLLNMRIVAEGVEDLDKLLLLANCGCDEVQGYYIGMPAPLDSIVRTVDPSLALAHKHGAKHSPEDPKVVGFTTSK